MMATFINTAFVLSIGIFFSLMVAGLSGSLPSAMSGGLIAQGIPAAAAHQLSHLPPIGVLFAAFLGYNPMKQLLGPLLAHLPAAHAAYVAGRQFFPHLITNPFHDGLGVAFGFAIAANVLAGIASLLTGRPNPAEVTVPVSVERAAAEAVSQPGEMVVPGPAAGAGPAGGALDEGAPDRGAPDGGAPDRGTPDGGAPDRGARANGQSAAIAESGGKKPG
jgi:hypothetical protein